MPRKNVNLRYVERQSSDNQSTLEAALEAHARALSEVKERVRWVLRVESIELESSLDDVLR